MLIRKTTKTMRLVRFVEQNEGKYTIAELASTFGNTKQWSNLIHVMRSTGMFEYTAKVKPMVRGKRVVHTPTVKLGFVARVKLAQHNTGGSLPPVFWNE